MMKMIKKMNHSAAGVTALATLLLLSSAIRGPVSAQSPGFDGQWILDPSGSDVVEDALDDGLADANRLVRGTMRKRLRRALTPAPTLRIGVSGDRLTIVEGSAAPRETVLQGSATAWKSPEGEELEVRSKRSGQSLVETFSGRGATREHVYRLRGSGEQLEIDVSLRGKRLPGDIDYTLVYRRAGG